MAFGPARYVRGGFPVIMAIPNEEELKSASARFLGFIVLAATGFIGEVQLSIAAHSAADNPGRAILVTSALCAAFISAWGGFAAAEAFTDMAFSRKGLVACSLASNPRAVLAEPTYPWAAAVGHRMRRCMENSVTGGPGRVGRGLTLNALAIAYVALLALIVVWAAS